MKTVILAEKSSQAAAYASSFQKKSKVAGNYVIQDTLFDGETVIVHASGHLLGLLQPDEYDPKWKKWNLDNLPIFPEQYKYKIQYGKGKQMSNIKQQLKEADRIIIATDSDREGENIARSIIRHAGAEKKEMKRLWINSLESNEIRRGFSELLEGEDTYPSYIEAQSREIADWLVGMNLSRLYTVALQKAGISEGAFSVGRVQTPTLFMIYRRQQTIENFKQETHYECFATITVTNGTFEAKYQHEFESKQAIRDFIMGKGLAAEMPAVIKKFEANKNKKEYAPRLYALSDLQRAANAKFKMGAKDTLAIVQSLYEAKLLSYPRTDSNFITHNEFSYLKSNLSGYLGLLGQTIEKPNISPRKKYVDDAKVQEHYAIIPTKKIPNQAAFAKLDAKQQKIYDLVLRRTMAMFEEDFIYDEPTITSDIGGLDFVASGKTIKNMGWKRLEGNTKKKGEPEDKLLPKVTVGETGTAVLATKEKKTNPPKPYTEGTLIAAMKNAGRDLDDEEDKEILKETHGIGTEATRAGVIENLKDRGYITAAKNQLFITDKGTLLCEAVAGNKMSDVAFTADWEKYLAKIHQGEGDQTYFLENIKQFILEIIGTSHEVLRSDGIADRIESSGENSVVGKCPICGKDAIIKGSYIQCEMFGEPCTFRLSRYIARRYLNGEESKDLLVKGETKRLSGFKKKDGKSFSTALLLGKDETGKYTVSFKPFAYQKKPATKSIKKKTSTTKTE